MKRSLMVQILSDSELYPLVSQIVTQHDGFWNISGIGKVSTANLVILLAGCQAPSRKPWIPNWWDKLNNKTIPDDEREIQARWHLALIRQGLNEIESKRHKILQEKFKSVELHDKLLNEARDAIYSE